MSKQNLKYAAWAAAVAAAVLILFGLFGIQRGTEQTGFGKDELVIQSGAARHRFHVEIAETPSQLAQGLMYRSHLDADRGMLFLYPAAQHATMWMHNTQIALDILFIDASGKIVHIAPNNRPYDDRKIPSVYPVRASLEINAGKAAELGIKEGDTVQSARLR